jgi:hypothetical protein
MDEDGIAIKQESQGIPYGWQGTIKGESSALASQLVYEVETR